MTELCRLVMTSINTDLDERKNPAFLPRHKLQCAEALLQSPQVLQNCAGTQKRLIVYCCLAGGGGGEEWRRTCLTSAGGEGHKSCRHDALAGRQTVLAKPVTVLLELLHTFHHELQGIYPDRPRAIFLSRPVAILHAHNGDLRADAHLLISRARVPLFVSASYAR